VSKVLRIILCSILITTIQCTQESKEEVVAQWKDVYISLSDFERTYFRYWQLTQDSDSPKLRRTHAQRMIEQELIAINRISDGSIDENAITPLV